MNQKIEIGLDEKGKRWCVYIGGVPVGISFNEKRDASAVAKWLFKSGLYQLELGGMNKAFEEVKDYINRRTAIEPF